MGQLDFSIIDKRLVKPEDKQTFGGRADRLSTKLQMLCRYKIPHTVYTQGSIVIVSANGHNTRYSIKDEGESSYAMNVLQACKAVKSDVRKYMHAHGKLKSGQAVSVFTNQMFTTHFIISGGRLISLVDVKHCYWKILSNFNIISKKTYEKYKHDREARLVAVGCLQRTETTEKHNGTQSVSQEVKQGRFSWVWNFVEYSAYKAISAVCEKVQNNVFSYVTDGVYLPAQHKRKAVEIFNTLGFDVSVKEYRVVGYINHYVVLEDISTGFWKRANLGISSAVKECLQKISVVDLNKKTDPSFLPEPKITIADSIDDIKMSDIEKKALIGSL